MTLPAGKSAKASAETAPPAEIQALLNFLLADPKVPVRLAVRVEPERETPRKQSDGALSHAAPFPAPAPPPQAGLPINDPRWREPAAVSSSRAVRC
jgi:hypothetical protein